EGSRRCRARLRGEHRCRWRASPGASSDPSTGRGRGGEGRVLQLPWCSSFGSSYVRCTAVVKQVRCSAHGWFVQSMDRVSRSSFFCSFMHLRLYKTRSFASLSDGRRIHPSSRYSVRMFEKAKEQYDKTVSEIREAGLFKEERIIVTPQAAKIGVGGRVVLNF